ncbi:MAG: hypothetical protein ACRDY7_11510 [Acidimicrobiia bacterium]
MSSLLRLAVEEGGGSLPFGEEIRGYLVVIAAVGLFCGSIYLLLATNLGARMGFLISFAALSGFLTMLGLIWFTNLTPLNALHGPAPTWKVQDVVDEVSESNVEAVRDITETGNDLSEADQGEIKAAVDGALTGEGRFGEFSASTDYVVTGARDKGGGSSGLVGHETHYAVMRIQGVIDVEPLPGEAPPPPTADPEKPERAVVLVRDLGSLRQPPLFMSIAFGILFAISLRLLHLTERDRQRAEAKPETESETEREPEPVPA